ncbi:MAG: thioredoxin family protein [Bacteroidetes bacterium]|nr:thioredoxin family protein [Bacteroidota bacterium]
MNNRIIVLSLIIFFGYNAVAQMNSMVVDPKTNTKMLMGYCDRKGLNKDVYGTYFRSQYDIYKPAESYTSKLEGKINDYEITIVLGTWCSDSQREVPRFFKVLNEAGFNDKRVKVIAVDKKKQAIVVDISDMNIERVPTFIIYKDEKEVGRIVETPKKSLERDLWKIIK